jgi:hypothetical protein
MEPVLGCPARMRVSTYSESLERLYATFATLGEAAALFEASELKHRFRRLGFDTPPNPAPFVPDAFFGEVVLTRASSSARGRGMPVVQSRCVFHSGVVVRPIVEGVVISVYAGRPELQVALGLTAAGSKWGPDEEARVEALCRKLGSAWSLSRFERAGRVARGLVAREDALHFIEKSNDDASDLAKRRDAFYRRRWTELGMLGDDDLAWLCEAAAS